MPSYNNVGFIEAMDSFLGQMFEGARQHDSTTPHQSKTKAESLMNDIDFLESLPCDRLAGVQGEQ